MGFKDYLKRRSTESIQLESVEVSWLGIKGKWIADRDQQSAAWEMYVELITRISVQPQASGQGLLREALSSLHSLFGETRRILKAYGPGVARPLEGGNVSFGQLAVDVLNVVLRPVLTRWHPALLQHEHARDANTSAVDHERAWAHHDELRGELEGVRTEMLTYANLLAKASGIQGIHGTQS